MLKMNYRKQEECWQDSVERHPTCVSDVHIPVHMKPLKKPAQYNRSRVGSTKSISTTMRETVRVMESRVSILESVSTWPQETQQRMERPMSVLVTRTALDEDSPRTF